MAYYFMEALVSFNPFLVRRCYTLFVLQWNRDEGVVAFYFAILVPSTDASTWQIQ
jgi:hypothetical protein